MRMLRLTRRLPQLYLKYTLDVIGTGLKHPALMDKPGDTKTYEIDSIFFTQNIPSEFILRLIFKYYSTCTLDHPKRNLYDWKVHQELFYVHRNPHLTW